MIHFLGVFTRGVASVASAKEAKRLAVTRFDLPPRILNMFRDKQVNIDLIRSRYNLSVSFDGKALILEGEDGLVASATPKISALQSAQDERQMIDALSSLLGEPIRVPLAMKLLALEKKMLLPAIYRELTWIVGTSDNVAHVWSDNSGAAKEAAHLLNRWSIITKGFQDGKDFDAEIFPHPSFAWLERYELQSLRLVDTLLDKTRDVVRVWAIQAQALERAKRFLTSPYRPECAQNAVIEFELLESIEKQSVLECLDRVSAALFENKDDGSIRLIESSARSIKVETFWVWEKVLRAVTRELQALMRSINTRNSRLSLGTMETDADTIKRVQGEVAQQFDLNELFIRPMRLKSSLEKDERIIALIYAESAPIVSIGKLFLDATPGLVKLNLGAFKDMHQTVSEAFITRIGRDLLRWGGNARHLRHWGRDWFSARAVDHVQAKEMQDSFGRLAATIVGESNSNIGYKNGVAIWHMDKGRRMIVARDKVVLDAYLAEAARTAGRKNVATSHRALSSPGRPC